MMTVIIPTVDSTNVVAGIALKVLSAFENVIEIESKATFGSRSTVVVSDNLTLKVINWSVSLSGWGK